MYLLSVVVITYNEEKHIGRCLDSVKLVADEIIVLDSYSTDQTAAIAVQKGAMVTQAAFAGYARQKNAAIALASNDYVLSLDADEALDETLVNSIRKAKMGAPAALYAMNRCTNYCGTYIRHGSWYPDKKIRLFNRHTASWSGFDLHEKIAYQQKDLKVMQLQGDILHFSFPSIEEHMKKSDKYSTQAAAALFAGKKKGRWVKLLLSPFWSFFLGYIIKLGFLDGYYGFTIAINNAHATFLKYIKLYRLQHGEQHASYSLDIPSAEKNKTNSNARQPTL